MYPPQDWREDYDIDSQGVVESTIAEDSMALDTDTVSGSEFSYAAHTGASQGDNSQDDTPDGDPAHDHSDQEEESGDTDSPNSESSRKPPHQPISIGQFFTGGVLSREEFTDRLPVLIYVVMLMLLYIANGFHVQQRHSRVDELNAELKRLNTIATTTAARRMSGTRQGEIEKLIQQFNIPLEISPIPPRIIEQPSDSEDTEFKQ